MLNVRAQPLRRRLLTVTLLLFAPMLAAAAALGLEEHRETVEELTSNAQAAAIFYFDLPAAPA